MLESLFTSSGRVKILEMFLLHKDSEFHTRDLARRIGISAPYVLKELYNLKSLGILEERKEGNMVFYRINKSSSIVEDLKRIFLKTSGVGLELSNAIKNNKDDIKYALIYGSFAKGTEITSSDIDLLIIGDIREDKILGPITKAQNRIGREINFTLWTSKEFLEKIKQRLGLIREIYKTPIIMILGDINEFKRTIKQAVNNAI